MFYPRWTNTTALRKIWPDHYLSILFHYQLFILKQVEQIENYFTQKLSENVQKYHFNSQGKKSFKTFIKNI